MSYHLSIEERSGYLHARGTGEHSPENALRYLTEVREACEKHGVFDVLLEMAFTGPSLDVASIFQVISQRAEAGKRLGRIAYVDGAPRDPERMKFAETVARNRGINVRLFRDVEEAKRWLGGCA